MIVCLVDVYTLEREVERCRSLNQKKNEEENWVEKAFLV